MTGCTCVVLLATTLVVSGVLVHTGFSELTAPPVRVPGSLLLVRTQEPAWGLEPLRSKSCFRFGTVTYCEPLASWNNYVCAVSHRKRERCTHVKVPSWLHPGNWELSLHHEFAATSDTQMRLDSTWAFRVVQPSFKWVWWWITF